MVRRNFTAASISSTSFSVEKALAVIAGCSNGSADLMRIWPRLVGRQFDSPIDIPLNGSGVSKGRSPPCGISVEKAWKYNCMLGRSRSGLVRKKPPPWLIDLDNGPPPVRKYCAPTNSLPHHGRRMSL